jgi:release factor glutamine methyltransferase
VNYCPEIEFAFNLHPMTYKELEIHFIDSLSHIYDKNESYSMFHESIDLLEKINRVDLWMKRDENVAESSISIMKVFLQRLLKEEPLQYITERAWFLNESFYVNPSVLIPRSETEELVWQMTKIIPDDSRVIDVGTGSGCIAISTKKLLPHTSVLALDVSEDAIKVAELNELNIIGRGSVEFRQVDVLADFPNDFNPDVIVSNPPYVTQEDKLEMRRNVLEYEPHLALFSETPLLFYDKIADHAMNTLREGGYLFFEVNENYGRQVEVLLEEKGFQEVDLKNDLSGRNRFIYCRKGDR